MKSWLKHPLRVTGRLLWLGYWKDMALVPHLVNLLTKRDVRASVRFTELRQGSSNRKELARQLHLEVLRLKEAIAA